MKQKIFWSVAVFTIFSFLLISISTTATAASAAGLNKTLAKLIDSKAKASGKVKRFAKSILLKQVNNPVFIKAIRAQNAKGISLNEIQRIDKEWKEAEDELPIHDILLNNPCTDEIKRLVRKHAAISETFVMDNQGANVCLNELTGDYWQGDEAKWKNSFNNGKGGIDVGTEKLDKSTNLVLQQVSVPIADNNGKVIGAITFGIKTGSL